MAIRPIVAYGCPILRQQCKDAVPSPEADACVQDLLDTLNATDNGLGIAAPQINIPLNIFLIRCGGVIYTMINPKILKQRPDTQTYHEGCLSIPDIFYDTTHRSKRVEVEFMDEKFVKQRLKFDGKHAVIFQHEFDHINGKMFIDYMSVKELDAIDEDLNKIMNGEVDVHYDMLLNSGEVKQRKK